MNISIGKITKIVDKEKRIVTVSSIYGQGDFSCEVLFSPIQVSVGNYVVVLSVDPTSNSKNYAIPLIRHANYPYDLNSIRINYFNSEITLKDKEISIYTVDDGRERVQAPVDPNDDIFNYYIYANSKGAKNRVNREVHYTHINLDKGGIEIGKFENGQKYSLLQMDKRRIELLKYTHDGYEEEEDFAYEDNVGVSSSDNDIDEYDSDTSDTSDISDDTSSQDIDNTTTTPEPQPLPEPSSPSSFGVVLTPKRPKSREEFSESDSEDTYSASSEEWVEVSGPTNEGDEYSSSGSDSEDTYSASSEEWVEVSDPMSEGDEYSSSISSLSGIESVNDILMGVSSYRSGISDEYVEVAHTEDEPDVLIGESDFINEENRVLVQQPEPPKRTGLNGRIIMLNDAIKVQRVSSDANIENTKIVDEIILTDEKIEIDFRNDENKKRTAIEIDRDGIRFRINKDDESVVYVRLDIYDYMFNLIMNDDDDKRIGLITMNMEGINIISYKDGQAASNIKVFEDKINIKSGGEMEIQSSKLKVPGNPVPSAIPMGGFCQIKFCPITGLPHTTPVLQTDRSINIEDLKLDT